MKRFFSLLFIVGLPLTTPAYAQDAHQSGAGNRTAEIVAFLNGLKADNSVYMVTHKIEHFAALSKGQTPIVTLVTCSDSRVQTNMFDRDPEGQIFTVRNIGNQLATAEGSVEYGVHHLHTPILMFLGHSRCGAIAAVGGNYSKESPAIKRELDTIGIPKDLDNFEGVRANIQNQVDLAKIKFAEEINGGALTVIGAILDFADDAHQGAGKFHLLSINGETDPAKMGNVTELLSKRKVRPATRKDEKKVDLPEKPATTEPAHH